MDNQERAQKYGLHPREVESLSGCARTPTYRKRNVDEVRATRIFSGLWCGEGDLFLLGLLKTSNLYIAQRPENTRSSRKTLLSHTTSHTGLKNPIACGALATEAAA